MSKKTSLEDIAQGIKNCQICPVDKIGLPVPGEGNPNAPIVFIGEAPGKQEAETGRPFVGRSGQLLRRLIRETLGLKEEDVYITSVVKYLPKRGTPTKADITHGMIHTQKQLDIINPKIIVLMGSVAAQGVLGERKSVTKERGKIIEKGGRKHFLTFHPAAALRFYPTMKLLQEDFNKLKTSLTPGASLH